jgi:hypothetical protein
MVIDKTAPAALFNIPDTDSHLLFRRIMAQSTSQKHQCFTSEPLGTKPCTSVAGIGSTLGKRLEDEGFDTAKTLLGQYLLLKGNEELFVHWFKEICGANSKQAKECFACLAEWEEQFM